MPAVVEIFLLFLPLFRILKPPSQRHANVFAMRKKQEQSCR